MVIPIFFTTSLIAAFVAGVIALFAPCCISFLLPAYLGQILQTRIKVILGTAVFSLGIMTVMLPTALGFRFIVNLFNEYHTETYVVGGLVMILAGFLFLKHFKLPMMKLRPKLVKETTFGSLFILGITSGLASSCCAPVLVAAITLTSLSPTFFQAILVAISYVLGMTAPLLLGAVLMRSKFLTGFRRTLTDKKIGGFNAGDLIGGLVMIGFGILIIYLALTGRVVMPAEGQIFAQKISLLGANINKALGNSWTINVVFGLVIVFLIGFFGRLIKKEIKNKNDANEK